MKLYIMKRDALENVKSNLSDIFSRYYTEKDNKWLWHICGENPFIEFREVQDFSLAPLNSDLTKGEIDMENCKIIYKNLMFISESQACDERLWAGLTHSVFYDYVRKRWGYDVKQPKSLEKSKGEIESRYFFSGSKRAGFYRNTLAKYWWVGRALYDMSNPNPFEKIDILGSNDFSTKVTDIFYSNTYASNPEILDGIIKCFKYYNDSDTKILMREHIRPTLQLLNAIGGVIILDCLSSDEISKIMIDNIEKILQGNNVGIENMDEDYIDDDENIELTDEQKSSDVDDEICVMLGCKIVAKNLKTDERKKYKVDYIDNKLPDFMKNIIGMKKGDVFGYPDKKMEIIDIVFN